MANPNASPNSYSLPVVSEATAETAIRDVEEQGFVDFFAQAHEFLMTNNPNVYLAVSGYVEGKTDNEEALAIALEAVTLFHQLLLKQSSGEALATELNLGTEE